MSTTSSNYWMNRVATEKAAERKADRIARFAGILDLANNRTWGAVLGIMWLVGTAAIINLTLSHGWTMLLTFVILQAWYTVLVVAIWKRTK